MLEREKCEVDTMMDVLVGSVDELGDAWRTRDVWDWSGSGWSDIVGESVVVYHLAEGVNGSHGVLDMLLDGWGVDVLLLKGCYEF